MCSGSISTYNGLSLEVFFDIAARSADELRSRLTPFAWVRFASLNVGRNLLARKPVDLESIGFDVGGVDASLALVECRAVRALGVGAATSITTRDG